MVRPFLALLADTLLLFWLSTINDTLGTDKKQHKWHTMYILIAEKRAKKAEHTGEKRKKITKYTGAKSEREKTRTIPIKLLVGGVYFGGMHASRERVVDVKPKRHWTKTDKLHNVMQKMASIERCRKVQKKALHWVSERRQLFFWSVSIFSRTFCLFQATHSFLLIPKRLFFVHRARKKRCINTKKVSSNGVDQMGARCRCSMGTSIQWNAVYFVQ